MSLVVLSLFVIGLILAVLIYLSIADVLRIRADKRTERPVTTSTASAAPATAPVRVGYLDDPAVTPPATAPTPTPVTRATAPVGVGYLDQATPTPAPTSPASAPVGVGYLDEPTPKGAPVGVGYMDVGSG